MTHAASTRQRHMLHYLLSAAIAAAAFSATGCESPLSPDYADRGMGNYTDALIVRAVLDSPYGKDMIQSQTVVGGVREMARVDSPGPMTAADALTPATSTAPGLGPVTATTEPGLASAELNMNEPVVNLSLQDAIARAVKHSLAIRVEAYNPAIKESLITQATAAFDPVVFGQSQWSVIDEPQNQIGVTNNGQTFANQVGIHEMLPSGAVAQISSTVTYHDATIPVGTTNPFIFPDSYTTNIAVQITQPLAKGFGADVNEANIYLAQRDDKISLETFRRQVITTVANTEEAYENLVLAKTNVDILYRLVKASEQTFKLVKDREHIDATKASINQALSALESRRADLLQAQKVLRQNSDNLKGLLNDPDLNISDNMLLNPTDKPIAEPIMYTTADCIETALRQRTEIQEARLQVERADIVVHVAKNNLLPQVDLVVGAQTNGLDGSLDEAMGHTIDPMNSIDFNAGIKIEFPLGNRGPEALYRQRQLEREQAIANMMQIAVQVVQDVKQQLRQLLSSYEEIQLRDKVRVAAGLEFEGIIEIEDIRAKTPEFLQLKLDSQANLAVAEQQLTQAIVNYNLAIMRLEQAKGTLLEFDRISLDKPPRVSEANDTLNRIRLFGKDSVLTNPIQPH